MYLFKRHIFKATLLFSLAVLLAGCANTKLEQSWVVPNNTKTYDDLFIIGIASSEQNRRAYESNFVAELNDNKIKATASYLLIKSSEKMNRKTVLKAIKGLNIDAVFTTHLVAVEEDTVYRPSPDIYSYGGYGAYGGGYYGGGHYGNFYNYYPHVNSYVHNPGYYTTHETYTLESNLYDVDSEELIWTARSRTFSPESIDEIIVDVTKLLIKDLEDKKLINK